MKIIAFLIWISSVSIAHAFDMPDIFSKTYKPNWVQIENNYFIDMNSVVKNKMELSSAIFKFESRARAKEVGVEQYQYTTMYVDFDCRKNEAKINEIFDVLKVIGLQTVPFREKGIWMKYADIKDNKLIKGMQIACK